MRDFVELLKRLKGKRVRIHFYIPAEAASATEDSVLSHLARIIDVEGAILKLDNRGEPAEREVGALETYLNLDCRPGDTMAQLGCQLPLGGRRP